jgi:predicted CXXCH cytochrome family protein
MPGTARSEGLPRTTRTLLGALVLAIGLGCGDDQRTAEAPAATGVEESVDSVEPEDASAYVGVERCASCHSEQLVAWRGSDHDRAMEVASREVLLAPFEGERLETDGQWWRFLSEGDRFLVERGEGAETLERLDVEYGFGVWPLQQLLVERERGRLQVLPLAWDSRSADEGGGRWFALPEGPALPPGDPLHWEELAGNWNSQCASCHSTALEKGYRSAEDRFDTRYAEIDVACEACHGPGRTHADAYAEGDAAGGEGDRGALSVRFEPYRSDDWQRAPGARIASRVSPRNADAQLDVCAPCHALRSPLLDVADPGTPFLDSHRPRLMEPGLYFDDGQIREEVYVWGSFMQSRMAAAGVRCNDCHDPHSLSTRREGNALCTGCHAPEAFDGPDHHGHAQGSRGSACVDCHMPARTYMGVDARRDHSFPMPRPVRSEALGAPDPCLACHADREAPWAKAAIDRWRADRPVAAHWADVLVEEGTRRNDPARWLEVAGDESNPAIVRGGAWIRFADEAHVMPPLEALVERFRTAPALERLGLVEVGRRLPPAERHALLRPLLEDPRRAIRVEAAEAMLDVPARLFDPGGRSALGRGLREYRTAQEVDAERPVAQVNLGRLALAYGDPVEAREAYTRALARAPYFVPAWVNLADLDRMEGDDAAAVDRLEQAVALAPDDALTRHSLGLALHRVGRREDSLAALEQAAAERPDVPRFRLGWALALDAAGRRGEAIRVLADAVDAEQADPDVFLTLVTMLRDEGRVEEAGSRLDAFARVFPGDPRIEGLRASVESGR